jgi:S1-C subfamily serine protease
MLSGKHILAGIGVVAAGAVLYANLAPSGRTDRIAAPGPAVPARAAGFSTPSPVAIQKDLGGLIASVRPAVVLVSAHPGVADAPHTGVQLLDPFPVHARWVGSGVIVDPSGYVLTCRHSVGEAETVRVRLFRGGRNTFLARRIASDPMSDLVLLKLPLGASLPFAPLGDSSRVRAGDLVLALGSPFGLAETVTQGIVSTGRRTLRLPDGRGLEVIQTDAAINQGNCGGPLVDIHGRVIGINLAIYSTDAAFTGIGFAVPSNTARNFIHRAVTGRI